MLTIDHVKHQYGQQLVLTDIALTLPAGQVGILIGANGTGKTTLLQCIAGWLQPDKGDIAINDIDIARDREYRQQLRFVPDTPDFYDEITAWEHLQFAARLHRLDKTRDDDWRETAEDLLIAFELDHYANAYPFTFSRGMRYKLALCMALLVAPPLLLLDEPFGPLDPTAATLLWDYIADHAHNGGSVLLSAHALPDNAQPDIYFVMRDGIVTQHAATGETTLAQILAQARYQTDIDTDADQMEQI